ncbi:MAG TPA: AraC family transcriptional regulator [Blastocatellia bacterium]|nr:AraC family transcriptional regulator [Blastocatellia bacterium]
MHGEYFEYEPPPELAPYVECYWTSVATPEAAPHLVFPDGCADILFSRTAAEGEQLRVIGVMTQHRAINSTAGDLYFGVRFRPAMASSFLALPGDLLTDQVISLDLIWGPAARRLLEEIGNTESIPGRIGALERHLKSQPNLSSVQRAMSWMVARHGQISIDDLARAAGLSARQFRRRSVQETGLTPKQLSRVIRFRHTVSQLWIKRPSDWAQFALDCGYYDQAHLINEFREFSGSTPVSYAEGSASPIDGRNGTIGP